MATLTAAMLDDLHRGCTAISILPYLSGGVTSFSSLDFSSADQIFTLQDSFQISKGDPSTTEIKVDQEQRTIDTDVEEGEWTLAGNIPSVAQAVLEYFYTKKGSTITGVKGQGSSIANYTSGQAYTSKSKEVEVTMLVESASKKTAIIFAHVKMSVGFTNDDNSTPAYLRMTGNILANTKDGVGDWAVVYA
ncbi:MAG: hypothetical protein MJY83_04995 [Bacteroidales bacterium]|nr:hypothetical protein [Bacteroidales bacterium]